MTFGEGRTALAFGDNRIGLRVAGQDTGDATAANPGPGTAELCFVVDEPVLLLIDKLSLLFNLVAPVSDPG